MLRLYHNPRCSKSRAVLARLQESGTELEVIQYLKTPLQRDQLQTIIQKLDVPTSELLREQTGDTGDDNAIIDALLAEPKLLQRPIIEDDSRAIIARPPERADEFLAGAAADS